MKSGPRGSECDRASPAGRYNGGMRSSRTWPVWIGLAVLGLGLGIGAAALLAWPRLEDVSPADGAASIPATAAVRLTFRTSMDHASVEEGLTFSPVVEGTATWEGTLLTFTPALAWPSDAVVTVRLAAGARSARGLPILRAREWSFHTGAPRVVYLYPSDGPADLYLKGLDGTPATRLTESSLGIGEAHVGRRGTAITYLAKRADGGSDVRLLDLMTSEDRLIYACEAEVVCRAPVLSPDGTRIALVRSPLESGVNGPAPGKSRVWILSTGSEAPFAMGDADHVTSLPMWAPNGRLAYHDATLGALVVIDPRDGPGALPLAFLPNDLGASAAWAPDSRSIVFPEIALLPNADAGAEGGESGAPVFYSHLLRGEVPSAVITDLSERSATPVEDASPAFSPDGKWLAFARKSLETPTWTPGRQLWIMSPQGDEARALTDAPMMNHSALDWRPDSQALLYMRFDTASPHDPPEVWRLSLPDGDTQLVVVGGFQPRWIP